ncbi:SCAN domain-containing protein 3-like [Gigaspora margarita]|uniref:SCAN domain-containing protein 3-like n=1 Tax=Gigaspora margarita TaxID=4874 RepID=A0A8H3XB75_GIGMA|nr:SCAN domain-containing protein 3-like [Gigaspora margarita]
MNECSTCIRNGSIKEKSDLVPVMSSGPLEHFQVDLVDLQSYAEHNDGYSYILTLINIFSYYIWTISLKDKERNMIHGELVNIFKNFGPPTKLQADNKSKFITREQYTRRQYTKEQYTRNQYTRDQYTRDHSTRAHSTRTILPKHILLGTILPETILPGTILPENAISQDNKTLYEFHAMQVKRVHDEVVQNDEAYQNKLVIRRSVHRKKVIFESGDKVAIAPVFDNNQKM